MVPSIVDSTKNSHAKIAVSEYSEVGIWLDSYDEIFSDFDPRPYSKRTISDDFILQIRKVTKDLVQKKIILKLLLLDSIRDKQIEDVIAKCLHVYFELNKEQFLKEKRKTIRKGLMLTAIGFILMVIASYISLLKSGLFYLHLLFILFEPAGWFILWMGLDHLVHYLGKTKKDLIFYLHMATAKIEFSTYV